MAFFHVFVIVDRTKHVTSFIEKYKESLFFYQFMNLVSNYGYVPNILCNLIYYLFYGPKLIDCLRDSFELNCTYHRHIGERKAIILIVLCILLCDSLFFTSYFDKFIKLNWSNDPLKSLSYVISTHVMCIMDYFPLHSLFYGEWLIRRSLLDLRERFSLLSISNKNNTLKTWHQLVNGSIPYNRYRC